MVKALSLDAKFVSLLTPLAADADATRVSAVVDTAGYQRVCFAITWGTIEADAATEIGLEHSDTLTDPATLENGAAVADSEYEIADDDDDTVRYIDLVPSKRYYQLTVTKDGEHTTNESAIAILYLSDESPTTHPADVVGEYIGVAATEA